MFNSKAARNEVDYADVCDGFNLDISEIPEYANFNLKSGRDKINIPKKSVEAAINFLSYRGISTEMIPFVQPTISPGKVSDDLEYLEHPQAIFDEFISKGLKKCIGELKHMGSYATIYIYKTPEVALKYSQGHSDETVRVISRNGLDFFANLDIREEFCNKISSLLEQSKYWEEHNIDMAIWGCEILPWNLKGFGLVNKEYSVAHEAMYMWYEKVKGVVEANGSIFREGFKEYLSQFGQNVESFRQQLNNYCWNTSSLDDIKVAPFHLLATSKGTYFNESHEYHLHHFDSLIALKSMVIETPYIVVDLESQESMDAAISYWKDLTSKGYEGMVFKTYNFTESGVIPMLKCRGKDYLRIIYGVNYDMEYNLKRLKDRKTSRKRQLHICELILDVLSLEAYLKFSDNRKFVLSLLALTQDDSVDIRL